MPLPASFDALIENDRSSASPARLAASDGGKRGLPRWSTDGWLMLRGGATSPGIGGFGPPSYGASQAGAVVRYRLAPASKHRPAAYLRATSAVDPMRDEEVAVGLSARPVSTLPVTAALELRGNRNFGKTRLRPAAMLISELPPLPLPLGFRAEAYGQAGYVGGDFAGPFADGQVSITRSIAHVGGAELRAGGGAWGGAQRGASRLDAGPTASLGLRLGPAAARVSADWRFRLAGDAEPQSGPALTLSAGF